MKKFVCRRCDFVWSDYHIDLPYGVPCCASCGAPADLISEIGDNLFKLGDKVRHVKSAGIYVIKECPNESKRLEYCNESFYTYVGGNPKIEWFRRVSEMEDGRFILLKGI